MAVPDRAHWDSVYRHMSGSGTPYPDPDPLLFMYTPPVALTEPPPLALDLACGVGQNGLWLATQGYTVDLVDISRVGLMVAQSNAAQRSIRRANYLQMDLDTAVFEGKLDRTGYDLVCVFRYFRRVMLPYLRAIVKPGGRIIYETWNAHHLGMDSDSNLSRDDVADVGELSGSFADWNLLRNRDNNGVSQLVAIKPV